MLARYMLYSTCVYPSVTRRYCVKTVKHKITQTTPHDSLVTLVFWSWRNLNGITHEGAKCRWCRWK